MKKINIYYKFISGFMEDIINQVIELRERCQIYQNELEKKLGKKIVYNDPRFGCFGRISNGTIITLELLNYYNSKLTENQSELKNKSKIESLDETIGIRFMKILRMFFIDSLSSIEHSVKNSISLYPENSLNKLFKKQDGSVPLTKIIDESREYVDEEIDIWKTILEIRNNVIYNNSIPSKDLEILINDRLVKMKKGKMMSEKPDFFLFLTLSLVNLYFDWVNKLIDSRK